MCHLYLFITTKERSVHDSFMPDKYLSRLNSHSLLVGIKVTEMKAPPIFHHLCLGGQAGGGYRYILNLSNSSINKSLIRSQFCNQPSQQQQQGSCRLIPPPCQTGSVWLPIGSGGLQWDGQSRDDTSSWDLLWRHRGGLFLLSTDYAGDETFPLCPILWMVKGKGICCATGNWLCESRSFSVMSVLCLTSN